jgi:hypothetical protein
MDEHRLWIDMDEQWTAHEMVVGCYEQQWNADDGGSVNCFCTCLREF